MVAVEHGGEQRSGCGGLGGRPAARAGPEPELRRDFVKKVYGILAAMLTVSFIVAFPFVVRSEPAVGHFHSHFQI